MTAWEIHVEEWKTPISFTNLSIVILAACSHYIAQMAIYTTRLVNTLFPVTVGAVVQAPRQIYPGGLSSLHTHAVDNLPWHIVFGFHESMSP
jgi:hypothetical protein